MVVANTGTPYNITAGTDLTGNNQFNARPTYAASCSEAETVQTQFGCLNTNPYGTGEKIIPYGVGTGPTNVAINVRLSKVIGIGPKLEEGQRGAGGGGGGGRYGGPPGLGGGGLSGSRGGPGRLDQAVARKYSLNFSAWGTEHLQPRKPGDAERRPRRETGRHHRRLRASEVFWGVAVAGGSVFRVGHGGQPQHHAPGDVQLLAVSGRVGLPRGSPTSGHRGAGCCCTPVSSSLRMGSRPLRKLCGIVSLFRYLKSAARCPGWGDGPFSACRPGGKLAVLTESSTVQVAIGDIPTLTMRRKTKRATAQPAFLLRPCSACWAYEIERKISKGHSTLLPRFPSKI